METIVVGDNRTQIKASIKIMSEDIFLIIENKGGSHIGTLAVLEPYKNKKNEIDVSISNISAYGHREYDLIPLFKKLARRLNKKIGIVAGIHIPHATKFEINQIVENVEILIKKLESRFLKKR